MTRKWSNRNLPGALHFVTGNVRDRLPIFLEEAACYCVLEECPHLRVQMECKLVAFVLMPDHFHLIVNPRDGRIRDWIGALKSISARRLVEMSPAPFAKTHEGDASVNQVWQESFKALPLWSDWMIWQKINYIHGNPMKAGLVNSAQYYRWSSFRSFYLEEPDPLLQVDREWWWADDVQKLERAMAEWDQELEIKKKQAGASHPS